MSEEEKKDKIEDLFQKEFNNFKDLLEKQDQEIKTLGETKAETAQKIEKAESLIEEIKLSIDDKLKKSEELIAEQKNRIDELEKKSGRPDYSEDPEIQTAGKKFIESDAYKSMAAKNALNSDPVEVKSFFDVKTLTSTITGGNIAQAFRYPQIIIPGQRALTVRDLLNVQPTGSNAIEYVKESGFTNNAAPKAEAAEKPESALTFSLETESVRTIAHWIAVSRQVLSDVSQLRAYIDTRLVYGLKTAEEDQILYGNGVSPNLNGIIPQATDYLWSSGSVGDTKLDCIRRAMTVARLAHYPVDGIILHPSDWEDIELLKGTDGKYVWISVTEGGVTRLFRTPVVETTAINSGEALVGAFGLGAILWDREAATVRVAEQHEDFFIKNLVAILAEERVGLTVFRPEAFVDVTFDSAPVSS